MEWKITILIFTIIPISRYNWFCKCHPYKGDFALHRALQYLFQSWSFICWIITTESVFIPTVTNQNTQDDDMAIFIASSRCLPLPKWDRFVAITHSSMTRIDIWIHCQFVSYNIGMKLIFLQIKSLITNCYIIKIAISRYGEMNEIQ